MRKLFGILLLLIMPLCVNAYEISEAELNELEETLLKQESLINDLQQQLEQAKEQSVKLEKRIEQLSTSFKEYEKEATEIIRGLKAEVVKKTKEIHRLQWGLGFSIGANAGLSGLSLYFGLR